MQMNNTNARQFKQILSYPRGKNFHREYFRWQHKGVYKKYRINIV